MTPSLGETVLYNSHAGDGIQSPAIVLRTSSTTVDSPLSAMNYATFVSETTGVPIEWDLPDGHVDLLVHGLVRDYREYNVPFGTSARTWTR